jgi:hypothetical protein
MQIAYPHVNEPARDTPNPTAEQETQEQVARVFLFLTFFVIMVITWFVRSPTDTISSAALSRCGRRTAPRVEYAVLDAFASPLTGVPYGLSQISDMFSLVLSLALADSVPCLSFPRSPDFDARQTSDLREQ